MKLATWNVNSLKVRLAQVIDWLAATQPDVALPAGTKIADEAFPVAELEAAGYRAAHSTARRPITASRSCIAAGPATSRATFLASPTRRSASSPRPWPAYASSCGYLPNGQEVGIDKYDYKLAWFAALTAWLGEELRALPTNSPCSAISTSPPRTATCTTRRPGAARSSAPPEREAFRRRWRWDWRMRSGCSSSRSGASRGGTTATGVSPQPGAAHRPHPARAGTRGGLPLVHHRQGARAGWNAHPTTPP